MAVTKILGTFQQLDNHRYVFITPLFLTLPSMLPAMLPDPTLPRAVSSLLRQVAHYCVPSVARTVGLNRRATLKLRGRRGPRKSLRRAAHAAPAHLYPALKT